MTPIGQLTSGVILAVLLQVAVPGVLLGIEPLACVEELHLPAYPRLIRAAALTGVARATVSIGDGEKPLAVSVDGVTTLLKNTVTEALERSRFRGSCKGENVVFQFVFELEYPVTRDNQARVTFKPPNVFFIRAGYSPISHGPPISRGDGTESLVIRNVNVVDVLTGSVKPRQAVTIRGERIESILPDHEARFPPRAAVADGKNGFLIPGLWDMHVHTLWDPTVRDTFLPLFTANGVTGIRDMGGRLDIVKSTREAAKFPRMVVSGPILDGPGRDDPRSTVGIGGPEQAAQTVEGLVEAGVDFIKVYTQLPRDAYYAVVAAAKRSNLPVAGHAPYQVGAVEAARTGMRSIEHMQAETGTYCPVLESAECRDLLALFRKRKTYQTPTLLVRRIRSHIDDNAIAAAKVLRYVPQPVRNEWMEARKKTLQRPAAYFERIKQDFRHEAALAGLLHRSHVPLLAGSDAGTNFVVPGFSLHEELALLAEAGMGAAAVLRTATLHAAEFLNQGGEFGTVEPGKIADLVLLEANPLVDIRNTSRIRAVIQGGTLLDRDALDRILREAADRARR
ncbi:MAG: amidohydrolase family protein [Bryobacterales bacterium]|nr:amidohydrolase family protein [Bryobacterales bacterium]